MKKCHFCIFGKPMLINSDILCRYKGIVTEDYSCRRFHDISEGIPEKASRKAKAYAEIAASSEYSDRSCMTCKYFQPSEDKTDFGVCCIFTVRAFDASSRKGCSRHSSRQLEARNSI